MSTRLGSMLRLYRAAHDVSLRDIAATTRISSATLSRIETGHDCSSATLLQLWSWLLEVDEARSPLEAAGRPGRGKAGTPAPRVTGRSPEG